MPISFIIFLSCVVFCIWLAKTPPIERWCWHYRSLLHKTTPWYVPFFWLYIGYLRFPTSVGERRQSRVENDNGWILREWGTDSGSSLQTKAWNYWGIPSQSPLRSVTLVILMTFLVHPAVGVIRGRNDVQATCVHWSLNPGRISLYHVRRVVRDGNGAFNSPRWTFTFVELTSLSFPLENGGNLLPLAARIQMGVSDIMLHDIYEQHSTLLLSWGELVLFRRIFLASA